MRLILSMPYYVAFQYEMKYFPEIQNHAKMIMHNTTVLFISKNVDHLKFMGEEHTYIGEHPYEHIGNRFEQVLTALRYNNAVLQIQEILNEPFIFLHDHTEESMAIGYYLWENQKYIRNPKKCIFFIVHPNCNAIQQQETNRHVIQQLSLFFGSTIYSKEAKTMEFGISNYDSLHKEFQNVIEKLFEILIENNREVL